MPALIFINVLPALPDATPSGLSRILFVIYINNSLSGFNGR
jgi:hypothetical protein